MSTKKYRTIRFAYCVLCLCIIGCQTQTTATRESESGSGSLDRVEREPKGSQVATQKQPSSNSTLKEQAPSLVDRILVRAQNAFRAGRYTTPEHDNAYDKFHSVLLLAPENQHARSGLQAILLKYAELIRLATSEGRFGSAKAYLRQAETYYPANALLMNLKKQIRVAQSQRNQYHEPARSENTVPPGEDIALSPRSLDSKSGEVVDVLAQLATRLKTSDESILIYARSDKEGRWIYKQLKSASQGYRIRGDIRISREPKIRIMPPL